MYRDQSLLDMARGRPCLLRVPGVCCRNDETTVACHSNQLAHGKGRGLKAHDFMTVWGCVTCHAWLDQGSASRAEKVDAFELAHAAQLEAWDVLVKSGRRKEAETARKAIAAYREWVLA